MSLVSTNPATGRHLATHRAHTAAQVESALRRSRAAFRRWRELSPARRAHHLRRAARALRRRRDELAALVTAEVGKPIAQSRAEIAKCATACDYYARHGAAFLRDLRPPGAPRNARVAIEPLGPILAIMPWNFPFWQAFRAAVPALMAGNTMLLKHAANVSGCALAIADLWRDADLPAGVFQTLLVPSKDTPALIRDPRIRGVTLTGSTAAGRAVAAEAGAALKPCVLELGGSDPYVVLADADLDHAAEVCAAARLVNSGQSCVSAKRFIVVNRVRREFERKLTARLAAVRTGDPTKAETEVGPMARADLRDELHAQVMRSVKRGAKLRLGGAPLPGPGCFYAPTVLTHVRQGMPAADEELFGPVAAVIGVRHEAEAIAVANDTPFGLGAAIFTRDRRRARALATQLDAGMVFINAAVKSDATLPFGGVKDSGYGRELGPPGILAFVNLKTIWAE